MAKWFYIACFSVFVFIGAAVMPVYAAGNVNQSFLPNSGTAYRGQNLIVDVVLQGGQTVYGVNCVVIFDTTVFGTPSLIDYFPDAWSYNFDVANDLYPSGNKIMYKKRSSLGPGFGSLSSATQVFQITLPVKSGAPLGDTTVYVDTSSDPYWVDNSAHSTVTGTTANATFNVQGSGPTPRPSISGMTPLYGFTLTSSQITIFGANLDDVSIVSIDAIASLDFTKVDSNTLTATIPAGLPKGVYDTFVTTATGLTSDVAGSADNMSINGIPTMSAFTLPDGLNPDHYNNSPTTMSLNGSDLSGMTSITMDSITLDFTILSDSTVIATVPAGLPPGDYDLNPTTPNGTNIGPIKFTVKLPPPGEPVGPPGGPGGWNFKGTVEGIPLDETDKIIWSWNDASYEAEYHLLSSESNAILANIGPDITHETETGLSANTQYTRKCRSYNTSGVGTSNAYACYTRANPPDHLTGEALSGTLIKLYWDIYGASKYYIERATDEGGSFVAWQKVSSEVSGSSQTYFDDTVSVSTTYEYRMWGFNGNGVPTAVVTSSAITMPFGPASKPGNFKGTVEGTALDETDSIIWSWDDASYEAGYHLLSSETNAVIDTLAADTVVTPEKGLAANTRYTRKVRSFNVSGVSTSNAYACYTRANPPDHLTGEALSGTSIKLYWDIYGASKYYIERATEEGGSPVTWESVSKEVSGSSRTYIDSTVSVSTTYEYRMWGFNGNGVPTAVVTSSAITTPFAPVVMSVDPNWGFRNTINPVTITGEHLGDATLVSIEGADLTGSAVIMDDNTITAEIPAGLTAGIKNVRVTNLAGTSANTAADDFMVVDRPVVMSVTPCYGFTLGDTDVVITGESFLGTDDPIFGNITIDATSLYSIVVTSNTSITAIVPSIALITGTIYDIRATNPVGTSANTPADNFTMIGTPSVESITPNIGHDNVPTNVVINGNNFYGCTGYTIEATSLSNVHVTSNTSMTAQVPSDSIPIGTYEVFISNPMGTSPSNPPANRFTVLEFIPDNEGPTIESISVDGRRFIDGDIVNQTFVLTAIITDELSGIGTIEVYIDDSSTTPIILIPAWPPGVADTMFLVVTIPDELLSLPTHLIRIVVKDSLGNVTVRLVTVRLMKGKVQVIGPIYNHPNPFMPLSSDPDLSNTKIQYTLSTDAPVSILIYNIAGHEVHRRVYSSGMEGGHAGINQIYWNGKSLFGEVVGNGMYVYLLVSGNKVIGSGKLVVQD